MPGFLHITYINLVNPLMTLITEIQARTVPLTTARALTKAALAPETASGTAAIREVPFGHAGIEGAGKYLDEQLRAARGATPGAGAHVETSSDSVRETLDAFSLLAAGEREIVLTDITQKMSALRGADMETNREIPVALLAVLDEFPLPIDGPALDDSHYEFYAKLLELLKDRDENYIQRFSSILGEYIKLFDQVTEIMGRLKDAVKGSDSDGNMTVNFSAIKMALNALRVGLEAEFAGFGGDFATRAEAQAFLDQLGLSDLIVKEDGKGGFQLAINIDLITALFDVFPGDGCTGEQSMSAARYNAIISAKDNVLERFNHINRVLPDKNQRALQQWDTLVKTLTATIDAVSEADRIFAQNLT